MGNKVSLIFVNYNSLDFLSRALKTLMDCEPELQKEVVVVDNASSNPERVKEVCGHYGARVLLLNKNIGYGGAANRGFRQTTGEYVGVANPDIEFVPGALTKLLSFLKNTPDAGVVSPQLLYPDGRPQPSCRRIPKLRYLFAGRRSLIFRLCPQYSLAQEFLYLGVETSKEPVEVETIIGAFMLFRREAFEDVGGFDEKFFMFGEDLDICERLSHQGWRVFLEPRVRIYHYYGGVRRKNRRFSDFHRIKSLYLFFTRRKRGIVRLLFTMGFAGYLFFTEAGAILGFSEYEYSWRKGLRGY